MSDEIPKPTVKKIDETPVMAEPDLDPGDKKKNKKDFWRGVGLWIALNIVMGLCLWGVQLVVIGAISSMSGANSTLTNLTTLLSVIMGFTPFVVNIGLMIYFVVKKRQQIALGMLAGFGLALSIAILLGVLFMAACFVLFGSYK
jgi:hypothetical protein